MLDELTEIKGFPGIADAWNGFCVHPDGSIALLYDYEDKCFIQIDLTSGERSKIKALLTEEMSATFIVDLFAGMRSSKLYIVGLAYGEASLNTEDKSNTLLVSFCFDKGTNIISTVHQIHCTFKKFPRFYREKDNLYLLSFESSTVYSAVHIDIDENGKLKTDTIVATSLTLKYSCSAAFVHSGSFYFVPKEEDNKIKLIKLPFRNENSFEINVKNNVIDEWSPKRWSRAQTIDDDIFFYTDDSSMQHSYFLNLDLKLLCWRRISIKMNEHMIDEYCPSLKSDDKGFLFIHGNCRLNSCQKKAHVYAIDTARHAKHY